MYYTLVHAAVDTPVMVGGTGVFGVGAKLIASIIYSVQHVNVL